MRAAVIGAGSWGTAFARLLALAGHRVALWARRASLVEVIRKTGENPEYLPGVAVPPGVRVTSDPEEAAGGAEVIFFAVPSLALRQVAEKFTPFVPPGIGLVHLAKGLEPGTGSRMSQVLAETLPGRPIFALSGPCHAEEVARDHPTCVVLAGEDLGLGGWLQRALMTPRFRVYLSDDLLGVEYCGAVKNVLAIGAGISDGLGYGDNTRAALITRGLAELVRFGRAVGAKPETFYGLAGLGDLVVTATSQHSRNRRVGIRIGRGERLKDILSGMRMVAEGVHTSAILQGLAERYGVDMPLSEAVYRVLHRGEAPRQQIDRLMLRPPKREDL
ncbi:NAD(P)-dependent glycerol-3-phosphate dehydrogenase [Candidatus Bipolaricaulota bacterium]|nr:NAD(P)-dependent glycerol-3-phosphate dehydrogenase [Candidatus Bipolaricaulota bacterium]